MRIASHPYSSGAWCPYSYFLLLYHLKLCEWVYWTVTSALRIGKLDRASPGDFSQQHQQESGLQSLASVLGGSAVQAALSSCSVVGGKSWTWVAVVHPAVGEKGAVRQ